MDISKRQAAQARARNLLDRAENFYLSALRAITLIIATILIIVALWLGLSGLYNISRDANSVKEEIATVSAEEVADVDLGGRSDKFDRETGEGQARPNGDVERKFYLSFLNDYFRLYQESFESFRRDGDTPLTKKAFDRRFLGTDRRIASLENPEFDFEKDRSELTGLMKVMAEVAALPQTKKRLQNYKTAKLKRVEEKIKRTRSERYCVYRSFFGCLEWASRPVKYTESKVVMKLPEGVVSHSNLFDAYQSKYLNTLSERQNINALNAENERAEILAANVSGGASLFTALQIIGGFLVLMFFFLLIAIERHQRTKADQ